MMLTPLLPGRMPNSLISQRLAQSILQGQALLTRLQEQISSGRKFTLPSEAPVAALSTLALQSTVERRQALQHSLQTNQGFLAATEQALGTMGDALIQARGLLQAGLGDQTSDVQRQGLALEVQALLQGVLQAGNSKFAGRYLFAGSQTDRTPFLVAENGAIRYAGDAFRLQTFAGSDLFVAGSVDGAGGLRGVSTPLSSDLNPALTLGTRLEQLNRGRGVERGTIEVRVVHGLTTIAKIVDLSTAETVQDVATRIEAAFAAEPITVDVDIDPGTSFGLRLTPAAGTIEVHDVDLGTTARGLGIRSGPVSVLNGSDVDPVLSLFTAVASLHGNTGIGATTGTGLRIVHGSRTSIIDLDGAATIAEVIHRIRAADPDLIAEISPDGTGLAVSSRLSGVDLTIGENGGQNATRLGLRTLTGATLLADLNHGLGVPVEGGPPLEITRRDGTVVHIDLSGARTVQDVLDVVNAVDPPHLTASLNAVGNGISLTDDSGSGPLVVADNATAVALGVNGTESSGVTGVLAGADVNPQAPQGVFHLLTVLETALRNDDRRTLSRLAGALDAEAARISLLRGEIGSRQQLLTRVDTELGDSLVDVQQQIAKVFETDLTEAVTAFTQYQQALQAALEIAARAQELSILNYL
jgi:flagellar hook-associated protein 3 FlgL